MSTISKSELRFPFSRQPAHCIIIDLTSRFNSESIREVAAGISNFFSIVCNLRSGSRRVPHFGMLVMTPYTEVLLPFVKITKSSYSRIEIALFDINKLLSDGTIRSQSVLDSKSLEHCIRDTISQFQKIKQNIDSATKLELTIIMCRSRSSMKLAIAEALFKVSLTDISHVNGISLGINRDENLERADSSPCMNAKMEDPAIGDELDLNGILDISRIDCDSLSMETFMKTWLRDQSIDREHLHIRFNKISGEKKLLIKCDIRERLIDFSELPYRHCFEIPTDTGESSQSAQAGAEGKPGRPSPIIVLQVVKKVLCSSICESVVFGKPILLSSSNCWQMEWDELENNQNYFNALCKSLVNVKEALICENITSNPVRRGVPQIIPPRGLFLLMPSKSVDSLLLKSIACRELLLNAHVPVHPQLEIVPKSAMDDVARALNSIEAEAEFNPLQSQSGLIQSLRELMKNNSVPKREPIKKYPAHSHVPCKSTGNLNTSSFQLANMKPATGKAARFVAPRSISPGKEIFQTKSSEVPTINLGLPQRKGKVVTFPDFTDF